MMKKLHLLLFKSAMALLVLMFLCAGDLMAQTPQYYNYQNVGASNNNFPLNVAAGKASQWLFLAGDFNQPTPVPAGQQITKVYLWLNVGGSPTYTNLVILMAKDTVTSIPTGTFYTGPMDTVYFKPSVSLPGTTGTWLSITLDKPFVYDPTKSLIVMIGQCGQTGAGHTIKQNSIGVNRRNWSVGGCPFAPYTGGDASVANFGVDVVPAVVTFPLPDVLYYKFRLNPNATTVVNYATAPPAGTNTATVTGLALGSGGQFDSCLIGTSLTGTGATHNLNTNWTTNIGTSSWTIGMWLNLANNTPGANACYLFGDPGAASFRCFWAGAGISIGVDTAILLRYTGMPDMRLPVTSLTSVYVHFVYDSAASTIKSYKNGVFVNQFTWTGINLTGAGPFKVAGYSTSTASMITGMKMDEFRVYKRALGQAEITGTWNNNLGIITGISEPVITSTPMNYSLSQNYPNPFNPITKINYALPKSGFVTMKVYDMLGREVVNLVNENKIAGNYSVDFNASNLTSGVYFYRLEVNGYIDTKKMMLIK